jgi:hypothetical protein
MNASMRTSMFSRPRIFWHQRREVSRNWLALGLLLAAWNAADHEAAQPRPESLRAYSCVSVRAAQRANAT